MEETGAQQQPKISIVTGVFALLACIVLDLVSLIPGVGDIESVVGVIGTTIGFVMKAGTFISMTAAFVTVAKIIPVIQELPLWSVGWIAIWIATNHPGGAADKFLQGVQVASAVEGGEAGLAEAEGGAAAAAGELGNAAEGAGQAAGSAAEGAAAGESGAAKAGGTQEGGTASEKESERPSERSRDQRQNNDIQGGSSQDEEGEDEGDQEEDEFLPEARDPMKRLGEDVSLPEEDFGSWDTKPGQKKKAA